MADIVFAFAALGAVIFIGFISALAFEKTKIPDVIVLIIIGLIFGPISLTFFDYTPVDPNFLEGIAPYFTTFALLIILFDAGLNLNFVRVLSKIGHTVLYAALGFSLSMVFVTLVCMYIFGFPLIISAMLGAILGGVSSAVVIDMTRKMSIKEETKNLITLESVISDVLCVVVILALIQFAMGAGSPLMVAATLVKDFSIAIVVGLVVGIIWLKVLTRLQGKPFSFMITIAMLLLIYSGVELVEGSGFVAALVFGLILGNKEEVARMFRIKSKLVFDERIKSFHSEVSFFIRTIFFVFLGLSFTLDLQNVGIQSTISIFQSPDGTLILFSLGIILITAVIMLSRVISTKAIVGVYSEVKHDSGVLPFMCGRGLTAAALATLPFTIPAFVTSTPSAPTAYFILMDPYKTGFLNITFMIILLTVAITSIGVYIFERRRTGKSMAEVESDVIKRKLEKEVWKVWKKEEKKKRRERIKAKEANRKEIKKP
ncbi:MAG: cation:proton antiporter [Thermoplasmata archaeon]|nr:cation:proton antiporter [Thermoplasmata archaeon]